MRSSRQLTIYGSESSLIIANAPEMFCIEKIVLSPQCRRTKVTAAIRLVESPGVPPRVLRRAFVRSNFAVRNRQRRSIGLSRVPWSRYVDLAVIFRIRRSGDRLGYSIAADFLAARATRCRI